MYRLSLKLKCWGVGLLLTRSVVLGNEATENRNGILYDRTDNSRE